MRNNKKVVVLGFLITFASIGFSLSAQPGEPGTRPKSEKMFETMLVWRLVDELQLSEEQMPKFLAKFQEERKLGREQGEKRKQILAELGELVAKDAPAKDLTAKLAALEKSETEFQDKLKKITTEIKSILTPQQQAKYVLTREKVGQDLMRSLRTRVEEKRSQQSRVPSTRRFSPGTEKPEERAISPRRWE